MADPNNRNGTNIYGIPNSFDLSLLIDQSKSFCKNENPENPWQNAIINHSTLECLQSTEDDYPLLLRVTFEETVNLYGFKLVAPSFTAAPNKFRIFVNRDLNKESAEVEEDGKTEGEDEELITFDYAENCKPEESDLDVELSEEDTMKVTNAIRLQRSKFSNVDNLTIYFPSHQSGGEKCTEIRSLIFIGAVPRIESSAEVTPPISEVKAPVSKKQYPQRKVVVEPEKEPEFEGVTLFGIKNCQDLVGLIDKNKSYCLNEIEDQNTWQNAVLTPKAANSLKSDCDEQLLMKIVFAQKVKLYGIKIIGPATTSGPNYMRIFLNNVNDLDFETAVNAEQSNLDLDISEENLNGYSRACELLPRLRFTNVDNVTILFPSNQNGAEEYTEMRSIIFLGAVQGKEVTDMGSFKRVAGKVGEGE